MNYQPLGDRLVCELVELEKKSKGGLILVDAEEDNQRDTVFARVIAAGEGKYFDSGVLRPVKAKVGDIVVYRDNMALKFKFGVDIYDIINEANVLMIVSGDDVKVATGITTYNTSNFTKGITEL